MPHTASGPAPTASTAYPARRRLRASIPAIAGSSSTSSNLIGSTLCRRSSSVPSLRGWDGGALRLGREPGQVLVQAVHLRAQVLGQRGGPPALIEVVERGLAGVALGPAAGHQHQR